MQIDIESLITELRATGREELVHYAGAAHRDAVAWQMCTEYLADKAADEATLKVRALKAAYGWDVSVDDVRATMDTYTGPRTYVCSECDLWSTES